MTTTSQTPFLSEVLGDEPIPAFKLAYFRGRLTNRIHALVLEEFSRLSKAGLINKAKLAERIGRKPEQVTRWLGSPGNWTIETLSDLLLAMKCEPAISLATLSDANISKSSTSKDYIVIAFPQNIASSPKTPLSQRVPPRLTPSAGSEEANCSYG